VPGRAAFPIAAAALIATAVPRTINNATSETAPKGADYPKAAPGDTLACGELLVSLRGNPFGAGLARWYLPVPYQCSRWTTSSNGCRSGRTMGASGRSAGYPSAIKYGQNLSSGNPSTLRARN
jgi:hypothetical protein